MRNRPRAAGARSAGRGGLVLMMQPEVLVMYCYVKLRIDLDGDGNAPEFGRTAAEGRVKAAEYLREVADLTERADDTGCAGRLTDGNTGQTIGSVIFELTGVEDL